MCKLSRSFALTAVGDNFTLHTVYTYRTFLMYMESQNDFILFLISKKY